MHNGELSKPLPIAEATVEKIGLLMGGAEPGKPSSDGDRLMRIELVKRPQQSKLFSVLSPCHRACSDDDIRRHHVPAARQEPGRRTLHYFIDPLTEMWSLHELAIKAAPLI